MMSVDRAALIAVKPSAVTTKGDQIANRRAAILEVNVISFHWECMLIRSLPLAVLTRWRGVLTL